MSLIPDPDDQRLSLSEMLMELGRGPPGPVSVGEIVDHFGARAFGAVLFVFAVPNLLPLPPGSSTVLGLPLLVIAPQLALGARRPWIPKVLGRRTIERSVLAKMAVQTAPLLRKAEALTKPRLAFLFGRPGDVAIGAICTLLAGVLILPIPLGNMLPAAAVSVLSLSLVQRDGALALLGYVLAAASVSVLWLAGGAIVRALQHMASVVAPA